MIENFLSSLWPLPCFGWQVSRWPRGEVVDWTYSTFILVKFFCTCTCYSTKLSFLSSDDSYFLLLQESSLPPSLISSSRFFTLLPEPSPDSAPTLSVSHPYPLFKTPFAIHTFNTLTADLRAHFCSASPSYLIFCVAYWSLVYVPGLDDSLPHMFLLSTWI